MSNETSNIDVFFDNLQVSHIRGPILEETHYYPFGLTMAGISSKALAFGEPNNKLKYNGVELNKDFDLNQHEFFYRNYDPQIGRWHSLDTKPVEMFSLYSAMVNNPILYNDLLGDTARGVNVTSAQRALDAAISAFNGIKGGDAIANLFKLGSDGVTFAPIDQTEFDNASSQLETEEAKALAKLYYLTINSDKTQFFAMLQDNETLDLSEAQNLDPLTVSMAKAHGIIEGAFDPTAGGRWVNFI